MTMVNDSSIAALADRASSSDFLVMAGGFEDRAVALPLALSSLPRKGVICIRFRYGPEENLRGDAVINQLRDRCATASKLFLELPYSLIEPSGFERTCRASLSGFFSRSAAEHVTIDISGMPQYVILQVLATVREAWPSANCTCAYIAANCYPPSIEVIRDFIKRRSSPDWNASEKGIDYKPAEPLCPNEFAGVGQRRGRSVMVLFAGYEKSRSYAAYNSVNPSKLLLIHSLPAVDGAADRLEFSKAVHHDLGGQIDRSIEVIDNLDVARHLALLGEYYDYLYDDHDLVLVPVHSKLQALACFLFWEQYRDVQVIFPIPVRYQANMGGLGIGKAYCVDLKSRIASFSGAE